MGHSNGITLHGDYFNSDTRAIASILEVCEIKFQFINVNTLEDDHRKESYLRVNKAGSVPTLIVGDEKILGGGSIFPLYLAGGYKEVKEKLYHENDRKNIETVLNWFYMKMMPETQRLIRLIVPPKVHGGSIAGLPSASDMHNKKEE